MVDISDGCEMHNEESVTGTCCSRKAFLGKADEGERRRPLLRRLGKHHGGQTGSEASAEIEAWPGGHMQIPAPPLALAPSWTTFSLGAPVSSSVMITVPISSGGWEDSTS